jgi:serine/threonine protein kinase
MLRAFKPENRFYFIAELETFCELQKSDYILKIIEWGFYKDWFAIITELPETNAEIYIWEKKNLNLVKLTSIIGSVINGVIDMHKNNIVHGSLNWGNVMIFEDGNMAKLSFFGYSFRDIKGNKRLTKYGKADDIKCLGIMIKEILYFFQKNNFLLDSKDFNALTRKKFRKRPIATEALDIFQTFIRNSKLFQNELALKAVEDLAAIFPK